MKFKGLLMTFLVVSAVIAAVFRVPAIKKVVIGAA